LKAERVAQRLAARPKLQKLAGSPRLVVAIEQGLRERWSPQQISARLKLDYPDDESSRPSAW
jgi:IS30 family transposase